MKYEYFATEVDSGTSATDAADATRALEAPTGPAALGPTAPRGGTRNGTGWFTHMELNIS